MDRGDVRTQVRRGVKAFAAVALLAAVTSPLFAADSWTLWRGMTIFTDVDARVPAEVQTVIEMGLDRAGCETMKKNKIAELRQSSPRSPGSVSEDGFIRLESGTDGTRKVLMRYLCVRTDARPGPAPWYYPGRSDPFLTETYRETPPQAP